MDEDPAFESWSDAYAFCCVNHAHPADGYSVLLVAPEDAFEDPDAPEDEDRPYWDELARDNNNRGIIGDDELGSRDIHRQYDWTTHVGTHDFDALGGLESIHELGKEWWARAKEMWPVEARVQTQSSGPIHRLE